MTGFLQRLPEERRIFLAAAGNNRKIYIRRMSNEDMPKRGFDDEKIRKIRKVLTENSQGLWVREIARKSGLDKSTVSIYLSNYMKSEVSVVSISGLVKIYRLRGKNE
ncbi:MAG: hypothetical protein Q8L29_03760 [archaeon]|nr:hypothetical protein [archaeon]